MHFISYSEVYFNKDCPWRMQDQFFGGVLVDYYAHVHTMETTPPGPFCVILLILNSLTVYPVLFTFLTKSIQSINAVSAELSF